MLPALLQSSVRASKQQTQVASKPPTIFSPNRPNPARITIEQEPLSPQLCQVVLIRQDCLGCEPLQAVMSFVRDVRNTTPVRKGHNVKPASAAERPEQSIGRLLDIVTDHGLQLKSLRQEHEALQQETKALRCALSSAGLWHQDKGAERELHSSPAVSNPSADDVLAKLAQSGVAQGKRPVSGGYPTRSAAKAEPAGSSSVCSTSAGSESGSSFTSSIRRSSSSGSVGAVRKTKSCPKARPKDVPKADAESSACTWGEERERRQRERGIVAPSLSTARQRSQSASSPAVTPRGTSGTTGSTGSTRRASSGSPLRRSRPRGPPPSLYQAAEPLLSASASKEKRALALGAISRALKDGAPPDKWDGPETPLRAAVQARSVEMARLLVEARANPNETDAKGVCVLHTASFDGLADLCRTLLQARADANAADQHGQTALFFSPLPQPLLVASGFRVQRKVHDSAKPYASYVD